MELPHHRALVGLLRSRRLVAYVALLFIIIGTVQVGASLLFYHAIDRQTLREDHARRVAELLVVSDRVHRIAPEQVGAIMTSKHLEVRLAAAPMVREQDRVEEIEEIVRQILAWEPVLARRQLMLARERRAGGRVDLVGSMLLSGDVWLNFRSRDISSTWPIALRATILTLCTTFLSLAGGLIGLRMLTSPLRRLSEAATAIAQGQLVPVKESGPADLRKLARSMNDMQARISGLVHEQARSFEAISHDLRTPLARMKVAADFVDDSDIARLVGASADEMEAMLMSLQQYLRAQHLTAEPEPVDLNAAVRDLLEGMEGEISLDAPDSAETMTYREPLLLALGPLIENAVHHGNRASVTIRQTDGRWQIEVADDGPGIAEEHFARILDPFFRIDDARARDTAGFGLGIPTAHSLLQRFGGTLAFANAPGGGLVVTLGVPGP
ncbi:sensor histidine kinase [Sphingobium lignivorans]|uniref:histidine kinase n=1 Tax=Sphingobium lignivorans TaxID=2735886 RepID=A0ABR6NK30_9SPHN|nr:HAMP domain-containing sensor histidine kinase [Sphingobium lignivorans]MBB5987611.1 signal transduction histidine kinase [Sphingobium lignivorans]